MTRPDLDAIRAKWKQRNVVSGNDVPTLLRHIDTLEHMLAEERENVDTLRAAVEHAEQRFVDEYDLRVSERDAALASAADAYRRGAEAMREACQQWCRAWENNGEAIADALADLRVEDK